MWSASEYLAGYRDACLGREGVDVPSIAYSEGYYDGMNGRVVQTVN